MFGRRKVPFGGAAGSSPPPPPPAGKEGYPIERMDEALSAEIKLFTRVLSEAGVDCGGLALRGPVPADVTRLLADSTTYRGEDDGGLSYLALGITRDFKAFMYPPHCRLYFIINSTGICEDAHTQSFLKQLAPGQLPAPMIDAHLMRRWIHYILPTGKAMTRGPDALMELHRKLVDELVAVARLVPPNFAPHVNLDDLVREWSGGFPAVVGRPLTDEVQRMNGLPVTEFIEQTLTASLAELQMRGLRERYG